MYRFMMKGIFLGGLALLLPACGDGDSKSSALPAVSPISTPAAPVIETFPSEGATHVPVGTAVAYRTDPPTSGNHYPVPQGGGYYETPIAAGFLVHAMEHGGVIVYYDPATVTDAQKNSLEALAQAHPGVFAQVVCLPRNDPAYSIILTAWTHRLRLPTYDQSRIDGFIALFLDQGPEGSPEAPWQDPTLSNATATSYFTSAHYLRISSTARPASASTATRSMFMDYPMTLEVDLQAGAVSALADRASIQILEAASTAVLAEAVYEASTGLATFSIGGTSFSPVALSTGAFHTLTFKVDAGFNATWSAGGVTTSPALSFGTPTFTLGLRAVYAAGAAEAPEFFFGNIRVTYP